MTEQEDGAAFFARVKTARIEAGFTQAQMAAILGIEWDDAVRFEHRKVMPLHLLQRFCLTCRVNMDWLLDGQGERRRILTREEVRGTIRLVQ